MQKLAQALEAAASKGMLAYVLADAYGSRHIDDKFIHRLRKSGVIWTWHNPVNAFNIAKLNHRLHKKLLIIDNRLSFTGGLGFAEWWMNGDDGYPSAWKDAHFAIEGPVVNEMQKSFIASWNQQAEDQFRLVFNPEANETPGEVLMSAIESMPNNLGSAAGKHYLELVNSATSSLYITMAYFGPPKVLRAALIEAAKRGVRVNLMLNGPYSTHPFVTEAGRRWYRPLLQSGVHIYEYQPSKIHSKLITVDGKLTSIGSANLNFRSFYSDEEFNILIDSKLLSKQIVHDFSVNTEVCRKVTQKDIDNMGTAINIRRFCFSLGRFLY